MLIFALLFVAIFGFASEPTPKLASWLSDARVLSGGSEEVRKNAIQRLKAMPKLESSLHSELEGKNRFLALDVISALKLKNFLDDLLRLAERDESGFFYNAIDSMIDSTNRERITTVYRSRVTDREQPWGSRVALYDSLARLNSILSPGVVEQSLQDPTPEIRAAALHYLRYSLLHWQNEDYLPMLELVLKKGSNKLKIQALFLISELSPAYKRRASAYLSSCRSDSNSEVRYYCLQCLQLQK